MFTSLRTSPFSRLLYRQITYCAYQIASYNSYQINRLCLFKPCVQLIDCNHNLECRRYKYNGKSGQNRSKKEEQDSDDEDIDEEDNYGPRDSVKTCKVTSMRADLILKIGLGIARNKIESAFYESKLRLNGKKILKKSAHAHIGDEIDVIKGPSPANPDFLVVGRVEILNAKADDESEGIMVKLKKTKSLIIENYPEGDPWKHTDKTE